jgi:3-deoxy-manno-octulosonate cytidylyltransferase (CMP-KDO synthetase)
MRVLGIIPARYASSRLPGKPLAMIAGKTMIQRVYERASRSKMLSDLFVATDDARIFDHVVSFGGKAVMTSKKHKTGTDRIAEAYFQKIRKKYDVVINIQGDEPFLSASQIDLLAGLFREPKTRIGTLGVWEKSQEEYRNLGVIKIVLDKEGKALYFSRSPIPSPGPSGPNKAFPGKFLRHLGMYGFRPEVLKQVSGLPRSPLEIQESLEQLRWLENGIPIRVGISRQRAFSVDFPADLARARKMAKK